jgi:hypothetical protein
MRARVFYRLSPTEYRLACTLDEEDADAAWRRLQLRPGLAGRSMLPGDVVYVADVYNELNGDGGWRVLVPGAETQRLYQLIVESS